MSVKTKRMFGAALLVFSLLFSAGGVCDKTSGGTCKKAFVCVDGQTEPGCKRVLACVD